MAPECLFWRTDFCNLVERRSRVRQKTKWQTHFGRPRNRICLQSLCRGRLVMLLHGLHLKKSCTSGTWSRLDFCLMYDATHYCGPRPPVLRVYDFVCGHLVGVLGGVIGLSQSCSDTAQHQHDETQAYVHAPGSRIDSWLYCERHGHFGWGVCRPHGLRVYVALGHCQIMPLCVLLFVFKKTSSELSYFWCNINI